MTPPAEETGRIAFRISDDDGKMLEELAEVNGLSASEMVRSMIRATYKLKFPNRAAKYETAPERFEREIVELATKAETKKGRK
jgi:hypothetical protein